VAFIPPNLESKSVVQLSSVFGLRSPEIGGIKKGADFKNGHK